MKRLAPGCSRVLISLALSAAANAAVAAVDISKDKAELTQEVTLRCIHEMAEFGSDAVQVCMQSDMDAADALTRYPPEAQPVVDRCLKSLWTRGYTMVQVCVQQDLDAAAKLAALAPEHAATVEACREKVGAQGAAHVERCVRATLAADPAARK
jgi:hypothetical protein